MLWKDEEEEEKSRALIMNSTAEFIKRKRGEKERKAKAMSRNSAYYSAATATEWVHVVVVTIKDNERIKNNFLYSHDVKSEFTF